MSKTYIPRQLRQQIEQDAHYPLRLNNDEIVASRSLWVQAGWHPPAD